VQRASNGVAAWVRGVWGGYVGLRGVRQENEQLRRELAAAQLDAQAQHAIADRTRGLEGLLNLRAGIPLETVAAGVIATGAAQGFRTITIDKGTADGLKADMAVIAPNGVIGRIIVPSARASKVQLLIDSSAAAGSVIERSRAQAIAVGVGESWLRLQDNRLQLQDDRLRLQYVSEVADVVVGDTVVTSGIDGIYPKGLLIGRVDQVQKAGGGYKQITVKPAVDFMKLEEVLVITTPPAREPEAKP
jgi:rod shape-determining protein MreC